MSFRVTESRAHSQTVVSPHFWCAWQAEGRLLAKVAAVAPEVQVVKVLQAEQAVAMAPDSLGDVRKPS